MLFICPKCFDSIFEVVVVENKILDDGGYNDESRVQLFQHFCDGEFMDYKDDCMSLTYS